MEAYGMRELYKPCMTRLGLCMFQLECLVQEHLPDLHGHFNAVGFDTSMYAAQVCDQSPTAKRQIEIFSGF